MPKAKYSQDRNGYYSTKRWDGTFNANGTKHLVNLRSKKSSKDLERMVAEFEKNLNNKSIIRNDVDFYSYAQDWIDIYKGSREASTRDGYEQLINKHFKRFAGILPSELRRSDLQQLITDNKEHPRTCKKIQLTLNQVIKSAAKDNLLSKEAALNLISDLQLPAYRAKEKRILTEQEVAAIKTADFTPDEKAFVYLLYGCGIRREEALALTPFSFDFDNMQLTVNKAVGYYQGSPYLKDTKSVNGERKVPIPDYVATAVKEWLAVRSEQSAYLFYMKTDWSYKSYQYDLITAGSYKQFWDNIRNKINYAMGGTNRMHLCLDLTAHIFRHTYCTNLCYQVPTISIKKIAQLLGDSEKMVQEVYSHIDDKKENVTEAVLMATAL